MKLLINTKYKISNKNNYISNIDKFNLEVIQFDCENINEVIKLLNVNNNVINNDVINLHSINNNVLTNNEILSKIIKTNNKSDNKSDDKSEDKSDDKSDDEMLELLKSQIEALEKLKADVPYIKK